MSDVGDRVRLIALPECVGTVVGMLPTPDYGPVPLVAWDDLPEYPEHHGHAELETIPAGGEA